MGLTAERVSTLGTATGLIVNLIGPGTTLVAVFSDREKLYR